MRRNLEQSLADGTRHDPGDAGAPGPAAIVNALSTRLSAGKLKWWASLVPIVFFVT